MEKKNQMVKKIEYAVVGAARKSAMLEANTACPLWGYQPKEPKQVKKLRRF